MRVSTVLSILAAIVAVAIGLFFQYLPQIIDVLIALENTNNSDGLERLKIGHSMAGGGSQGSQAMSDAIKTMLLSQLFGRVQSTSSREAWRRLVHVMHQAEREYLSPAWGFGLQGNADDAADEIAEGLQYVAHVIKLALDVYLEDAPRFVRMVSPYSKLLGDHPDGLYHMSILRPIIQQQRQPWLLSDNDDDDEDDYEEQFVVEGCRSPREVYVSFSIHAPSAIPDDRGGALERVVSGINDNDIQFDENGCYHLLLSLSEPKKGVEEQAENLSTATTWLRMPLEATTLIARHYYDASQPKPAALHETVDLSIRYVRKFGGNKKQLSSPSLQAMTPPPLPPTDPMMAHRIDLATDFIRRHTLDMTQPDPTTAPKFFSLIPNTIGRPQKWSQQQEGMGNVDIAYAAGRFRLGDEEALIMEGVIPKCRFASVVLWNRWMQSFDYTRYNDYPVSVNLKTPTADEENEPDSYPFLIVVSKTKPTFLSIQAKNNDMTNNNNNNNNNHHHVHWMYTEGRPMGTIFFRILLPEVDDANDAEGDTYQPIHTTVVPRNELEQYLTNMDRLKQRLLARHSNKP